MNRITYILLLFVFLLNHNCVQKENINEGKLHIRQIVNLMDNHIYFVMDYPDSISNCMEAKLDFYIYCDLRSRCLGDVFDQVVIVFRETDRTRVLDIETSLTDSRALISGEHFKIKSYIFRNGKLTYMYKNNSIKTSVIDKSHFLYDISKKYELNREDDRCYD